MPKRKHDCDECYYIKHKNRKKYKKSKRSKRHRRRSPSTSSTSSRSSRYSRQSLHDYEGETYHEYRADLSESPIDDIILNNETSLSPKITDNMTDNQQPSENTPQSVQNIPTEQQAASSSDAATVDNVLDITSEQSLDPALLDILGEDPCSKSEFGKEVHKDLANRLEHIATSGLSKEVRKELLDKYLTPSNCVRVGAPLMNPEIKAALPDLTQKRDKGMESRQKQLTCAITGLGHIITNLMNSKDKDNELLKGLMDVIRILCDVQHTDSVKRRYFTFSALKKDINDQLTQTKIDKFLFGENLAETLKMAKAVSKSGAEIKNDTSVGKNVKKPAHPQPSTSRNLNWRAPPPARRQPGPAPHSQTQTQTQRSRPPAPPRKHDFSSRPSRHQFKRTRHH